MAKIFSQLLLTDSQLTRLPLKTTEAIHANFLSPHFTLIYAEYNQKVCQLFKTLLINTNDPLLIMIQIKYFKYFDCLN